MGCHAVAFATKMFRAEEEEDYDAVEGGDDEVEDGWDEPLVAAHAQDKDKGHESPVKSGEGAENEEDDGWDELDELLDRCDHIEFNFCMHECADTQCAMHNMCTGMMMMIWVRHTTGWRIQEKERLEPRHRRRSTMRRWRQRGRERSSWLCQNSN